MAKKWQRRRMRAMAGAAGGISDRSAQIAHYQTHIYPNVAGWLEDKAWEIIALVGDTLDKRGIRGDVCEFGVYHGRFLLLIASLANSGEECIAVDLFDALSDEQTVTEPDWRPMRKHTLAAFKSNCERFLPGRSIRIMQRDTMKLRPADFTKKLKFLSIDAWHDEPNVVNDLILGHDLLRTGGVIALDDWRAPRWPGVAKGFNSFMEGRNHRLVPFMFAQHKLWLTTTESQAEYLDIFRERFGSGTMFKLFGADCLQW